MMTRDRFLFEAPLPHEVEVQAGRDGADPYAAVINGPRVVFIPGIMGSMLVDPVVPAAVCRELQADAALVLQREPVVRAVIGSPAALGRLLCQADLRTIRGRLDMLPWVFSPSLWRERLLKGNGLDNAGGILAGGTTNLAAVDPYGSMLKRLRKQADLLPFTYDWRLSNHISAGALASAIGRRWWATGQPARVPEDQRVTIIAHSMGGLVARYYIEGLNGQPYVKRLITIGTPHAGSPVAYTNYFGQTLPFGWVINTDTILRWLAPLPSVALHALRARIDLLVGSLMPPGMQMELIRSYASALQLLPTYDFVTRRGGIETVASSYGQLRHLPTRSTVARVTGLLRSGLKPFGSLNTWLAANDLRYTTIGSAGRSTVMGFNADRQLPVRGNDGDDTVPLSSALLLAGSNIERQTVTGLAHQDLCKNPGVQATCLNKLGIAPPREIESELVAALA